MTRGRGRHGICEASGFEVRADGERVIYRVPFAREGERGQVRARKPASYSLSDISKKA